MYKIKVTADDYHAKVKKLKEEYKEFGIEPPEVIAVDMNGAYVPMDKSNEDSNLERMSESNLERFGLGKGGGK